MMSHNSGESWGLAVHKYSIYTVGDDNQLLVWNMKTRQVEEMYTLWTKAMEKKDGVSARLKKNKSQKKMTASTMSKLGPGFQARACAVNQKERHIAIAFNDCKIVIKSLFQLESYLDVLYEPNEWCECLE
jgi:fructose 1,6-bisphosphatase